MTLTLTIEAKHWPLREPFTISRGTQTGIDCLIVTLSDAAGRRGRGEGIGVNYAGETLASIAAQIEAVRLEIEAGVTREGLLSLLPPGGARCAIDHALWDLDAKVSGQTAFAMAGVVDPGPVVTAFTIGIRDLGAYLASARERARYPLLKVKVDSREPLEAIAAVHRGAPDAALIVDPNQAWSVETLKTLAPKLVEFGVVLLEQPIKVGDEPGLDGYRSPIPLCADELIQDSADLDKAKGRFQAINIKLDKAGGLTEGLKLAKAGKAAGFELMVGCMAGSSLSMAPAMVLAQQCAFVDLDGPLLQSEDWPDGLVYHDGRIALPDPHFWG
jgi:L-alanine-DL-glutamate epimerase-like enolase superfamily enzyme